MAIEVFNRFEHKYLIDEKEYERIREVIEKYMDRDSYNIGGAPYTIANIYYDTKDDYLIRKSLSKPPYKEKLRLRAYGVPTLDDRVFLEIKKKYKGIVNKRRTALSLCEAYDFIEKGHLSNIKPYMNLQVAYEIEYFLSRQTLYPKVYLAYDRIAYLEKGSQDLRISFDQNIRARRSDVALEKGDWGETLMNKDSYLMEIKTARAKPLWLTALLSEHNLRRSSFSKYGTEFRRNVAAV